MNEQPICFEFQGATLVGMLHRPPRPQRRGVLVVVGGGPQYRAGGHRQLVLWSRRLAEEGFATLRFDYRGMGDSSGEFQGFERIDDDIRAAIDHFFEAVPELEEVVLWGECDGASAILFYAYRDRRVCGAVLLNPWARTEALRARAVLRHYYLKRLAEPDFWRKLVSLRFNPWAAARSAFAIWRQARMATVVATAEQPSNLSAPLTREGPLPGRVLEGMQRFDGRLMLVMSGRDLIAREFDELVSASPEWRAELARKDLRRHDLAEGDHTFSSAAMRQQVIDWALAWLRDWPAPQQRLPRG
jgi:uncharacterized protein